MTLKINTVNVYPLILFITFSIAYCKDTVYGTETKYVFIDCIINKASGQQ